MVTERNVAKSTAWTTVTCGAPRVDGKKLVRDFLTDRFKRFYSAKING